MAEIAPLAPKLSPERAAEESGLGTCPRCRQVRRLLAVLEACIADLTRLDAQLGVDHLRAAHRYDPNPGPTEPGRPEPDLPQPGGASPPGPNRAGQWVSWGELRLERRSRRGFRAAQELPLTSSQFTLLWELCAAEGAVVSTDELSRALYGRRTGDDHDRVYAHVRRVRRLIEPDPAHATVLVAVRGEGFRLGGTVFPPVGRTV